MTNVVLRWLLTASIRATSFGVVCSLMAPSAKLPRTGLAVAVSLALMPLHHHENAPGVENR